MITKTPQPVIVACVSGLRRYVLGGAMCKGSPWGVQVAGAEIGE
jgi:hypothetical protein